MLRGARIAVVEDDEIMGGSLVQRLELEGADVLWLRQVTRALGALRTPRGAPIDAVICDIRLPDGTGENLFVELHKTTSPPPFLFITGHGGIEQAVRLIRAGAADYVTKPFEMPVLLDRLAALLTTADTIELPPLLGVSAAARKIEQQIGEAAQNDRNILVIGGPGTGKGLIADRVHRLSDRRAAPFISVSLAREADAAASLLRSGGAIDQVGEGHLYIHAIDLLPSEIVNDLLARLTDGFVGRIIMSGGHEVATAQTRAGPVFDLIYRLDMDEIAVPPLGQRPEDAVWLLSKLFARMNARRSTPLEGISSLSEEAVRGHDWTGGGRELRARLNQAMASAPGPLLQPSDLFTERVALGSGPGSLVEVRDAAERRHIIQVLDHCDGHIGAAAKAMKISRTTLWEKMQKYGISKDSG